MEDSAERWRKRGSTWTCTERSVLFGLNSRRGNFPLLALLLSLPLDCLGTERAAQVTAATFDFDGILLPFLRILHVLSSQPILGRPQTTQTSYNALTTTGNQWPDKMASVRLLTACKHVRGSVSIFAIIIHHASRRHCSLLNIADREDMPHCSRMLFDRRHFFSFPKIKTPLLLLLATLDDAMGS